MKIWSYISLPSGSKTLNRTHMCVIKLLLPLYKSTFKSIANGLPWSSYSGVACTQLKTKFLQFSPNFESFLNDKDFT